MRSIIIVAMLLSLTACAQTKLPSSANATDWQVFGKQTALKGSLELSEDRIAKLDDTNRVTPELIMSYQTGYQEGKEEYCQQSAYILGVQGAPYYGICDDLDPLFRNDYESGRLSTAGGY